MSANFNYYLNRQGPRGKQGEKGEEGFSPVITVAQSDSTTYKLLIQSQDGYIETPNLKANPLQITQGGGKYVLYDTENNLLYNAQKPSELVDTSMYATTSDAGIISIADEQDLTDSATNVAVTPKQLNDAIDAVESEIPDAPNNGVLTIQQNGVNIATFSADSATNVTANIQTPTNVVTTDTNQTITGNKNFEGTLLYDGNEVATLNDIPSIPTNYVTTDTTQTISGSKTFSGFFNTFSRSFRVTEGSSIQFIQAASGGQSTTLSIRHALGDSGLMVTAPNGNAYYKVINSNDFDGTTIVYNNGVISAVAQTPSIIDGGEEV